MAGTYIANATLWIMHKISFLFKCEHCGKDNIQLDHEIFCRAILSGGNIPTDEKERGKVLYDCGQVTINEWLKKVKKISTKGDNSFIKGTCPFCNKYQTWAMPSGKKSKSLILKKAIKRLFGFGALFAFLAMILVMVIGYTSYQNILYYGLKGYIIAGIISFIVVGFIAFMYTFTKGREIYKQYESDTKDVKEKQTVQINWNDNVPYTVIDKTIVDNRKLETKFFNKGKDENITVLSFGT